MANKKIGYVLAFMTVIIWGLENVLLKVLLSDVSPNVLTYVRLLTLTVVMTVLTSFHKKEASKECFDKKYLFSVIGMGVFLVGYYIFSMNGLNLTKAVISEFLGVSLNTLFTIIILAIFIREERKEFFNKYVILALVISLVGTYFTAGFGMEASIDIGAILVIISSLCWGIYMTFYRSIDKAVSVVRINRDLDYIALLIYTVIMIISNEFMSLFTLDLGILLKMVLVAVFVDVGTILTYYVAIRIISGVKCSILSLLSPIIAFFLSYLWLGERISVLQLVGCILLFASSLVLIIKEYVENKKL